MFRWSAFRLNRLRSAVRSYNAAITRRSRELFDSGLGHLSSFLPQRVTVDEVRSRIRSVNDFRRIVGYKGDARRGRTSELSRILKSVNPHALDFTEDAAGGTTTVYEKRQYAIDIRVIRRQREKSRAQYYEPLYDGDTEVLPEEPMSEVEEFTFRSDTDMVGDDEGEWDDSVEDIDPETRERWRREDARRKAEQVRPDAMYEVYMDVWKDPLNMHQVMPGYRELIDAMEWLVENRTDVLNKMFNSGRDEIDPWYITESGGARNPYVNTPYDVRHNRAVSYVVSVARGAGYEG